MMQIAPDYYLIAISLIVTGIVLMILGLIWRSKTQQSDSEVKSKGIVLLGPIPIVWGFGEKGKTIAVILAISAILLYLLIFF
ncbi:MAG: TIGR00304 family membrane protein [Promethearchaeia archaeon]